MSDKADQNLKEGEISLDISQLRPGVHVRLPLSWMEHQFMFSSFVISDEEQIKQIAALNLDSVMCDPSRCKNEPLPPETADDPRPSLDEAEKARLEAVKAEQMAQKMERAKVVRQLQQRLDNTQKHYVGATKAVSEAFKYFEADPDHSVKQIKQVSQQSTEVLLSDVDSAIVLIAEKGQNDGASAHSLSVMTLSLLLGKQALLPEEALNTLAAAALLHDIGKAKINSSILRNQERNKHEQAIYETHCTLGFDSAMKAGNLSKPVLLGIRHHHEHFDGSGFPDQIAGEKIHIAARIIGIANRFDNLTNPIDYRTAMSPSEALSRMWVKEKQHFDPKLLQLFIRAMGVYPPGSLVQLTDGRIGTVVVSAPHEKKLSPQVMIYDPDIPRHHAVILNLTEHEDLKIDHAVRLRDRSEDELDYLLPRRKLNWFHAKNQKS